MSVIEVKHPLIQHKLGLMRANDISTKDFRQLAKEVGSLLTYEATKDYELEEVEINSWRGSIKVEKIKGPKVTLVPILRAGLGMLDGVIENMPGVSVSVVGVYRDEETLQAIPYFDKLIKDIDKRAALVVDPMLATGGSLIATVDLLKKKGCKNINAMVLVAAPEGIEAMKKSHPDVNIITASIDECINNEGYIVPGLGDAGDKIFGTKC